MKIVELILDEEQDNFNEAIQNRNLPLKKILWRLKTTKLDLPKLMRIRKY
ncbi:MAG: hypothetical protein CM15mV90_330 [uncultured marine virus]|nr:MAG: hypothetical protein CM15mV90_330 [uncultured marine virus]